MEVISAPALNMNSSKKPNSNRVRMLILGLSIKALRALDSISSMEEFFASFSIISGVFPGND
jgi:hypothetical protein